jgi:hypothetical protein
MVLFSISTSIFPFPLFYYFVELICRTNHIQFSDVIKLTEIWPRAVLLILILVFRSWRGTQCNFPRPTLEFSLFKPRTDRNYVKNFVFRMSKSH